MWYICCVYGSCTKLKLAENIVWFAVRYNDSNTELEAPMGRAVIKSVV